MLRINLISAYRSLTKNGLTTFINILGLAIAFVATFLIVQYIHFEESFDKYHANADRIYRVETDQIGENTNVQSAYSYMGIGMYAKDEFPEIENSFSSLFNLAEYSQVSSTEDGNVKSVKLDYHHNVTPSVFDVFSFELIYGSFDDALNGPSNAVITKSLSDKLFGPGISPIGKTIDVDNGGVRPFNVSAVVNDLPENSHFKFELMEPMDVFERDYPEIYESSMWTYFNRYSYLVLKPETDIKSLEDKLTKYLAQHQEGSGINTTNVISLRPATDIHLKSQRADEHEQNGDYRSIRLFSLIAVLILVIAYMNYINISTSINLRRAKEVGVKKIMGSTKAHLILQFLMESLLINSAAFALALVLLAGVSNYLQELFINYPSLYLLQNEAFWLITVLSLFALSLLSGMYPALIISGQSGIAMLKGVFVNSRVGTTLHKSLVVFQFTVAAALIFFVLVINGQVQFMMDENLGVELNQTLILTAPPYTHEDPTPRLESFREQSLRNPQIAEVTSTTGIPGEIPFRGNIRLLTQRTEERLGINNVSTDHNYSNLFGLQLLAGRWFSKSFPADINQAVVVNEKLASDLGYGNYEDLVGNTVIHNGDTLSVVGVVQNYHHNSLKVDFDPMAFRLGTSFVKYVAVKMNTQRVDETVGNLKGVWEVNFPGIVFDYFFADDNFNRQYMKEQELGRIIIVFSSIAIIIGGLGLFALSMLSMSKRMKEVGIRKVLGAETLRLFWHLSKEIVVLIIVAGLLATPISILLAGEWLSNFANRIELSLFYVISPFAIILVITLLTISYNVMKTLRINPTETLRQE